MSNPRDGTTAFALTYLASAALAPNQTYTGSADNVSISADDSASPATGYIAFAAGYGKFYTSQSTSFNQDALVFTKQ